jgi:hypothetical protein
LEAVGVERRLRRRHRPAAPEAEQADYARPSSNHFGVLPVTFCDGSGRTLPEGIDSDVYKQLTTPSGRGSDDKVNRLLTDDDLR